MAERVVVDTDVMSFVFKGHDRAAAYVAELDGKQIVISFMTVAELKRWALKKRWGASRIAKLNQQLRQVAVTLPMDFSAGLCLPRTGGTAGKVGSIKACINSCRVHVTRS